MIGVGVIGCGRAATELHLPIFDSLNGASIEALCDVDPFRLQAVARKYGGASSYQRFEALLADRGVDLVAICVPASMRGQILRGALEQDKNIFVEKPLALNVADAEEICRLVESTKSRLFLGHHLRCHRLVERCRELLRNEALGALEIVSTTWTSDQSESRESAVWRSAVETGGGVLHELGVHHFDLIEWLLEDRLDTVWGRQISDSCEISSAVVTGSTVRGTLVTAAFSEESIPRNRIELCGKSGRIELDLYRYDGLRLHSVGSNRGMVTNRLRRVAESLRDLPAGARVAFRGGEYMLSYRRQWSRIMNVLQGGQGQDLCTPLDGLRAVQIAAAALESIVSGAPVEVPAAASAKRRSERST